MNITYGTVPNKDVEPLLTFANQNNKIVHRGGYRAEIGLRVGKTTVVSKAFLVGPRAAQLCKCDCGTYYIRESLKLKPGNPNQSCGCWKRARFYRHGLRRTPEYSTWMSIKKRCLNPNNTEYHNYGGRGITVCDRWLASVENFLADMGKRPRGYSIDRVDNNKGYSPENCRWATPAEQARNTRRTKFLTINGESKPRIDWMQQFGIDERTFRERKRYGWDDIHAITTPATIKLPRLL